MRVIAGALGGRIFDAPKGHKTHPMSERARGGLFNKLGNITSMRLLDPFAGSGAISIEAVSRGVREAIAIEKDLKAYTVLRRNCETLNVSDRIRSIRANCRSWSENNPRELFDLIICDPPYQNIQLSTVTFMLKHLNHNGLMVLSHTGRGEAPTVNGVVVVDKRLYGDAALSFYRLEQDSGQ